MSCPRCGHSTAAESNFCSACGVRINPQAAWSAGTRVVRLRHPRMIAGICSGLAQHFGWDVALVRIALVAAVCLTTGCAILFYLAAWIIVPIQPYQLAAPAATYPSPGNGRQSSAA